ncbi:MAG: hypothetical protein V4736_09280 [Bdellovibrionota bacterium]
MKFKTKFLKEFVLLTAVAVIVPILFKIFEDRATAGLVAGALFVGVPAGLLWDYYYKYGKTDPWWYLALGQFLFLFAVPILAVRLYYGAMSFDQSTIFGFSISDYHRIARNSFLLAWVGAAFGFGREWLRNRRKQPK